MKYVLLATIASKLGSPESLGIPNQQLGSSQLGTFLSGVYYIAGAVAVITMVIAGIMYVISVGDAGKVAKAKNAIIYSAVGLVLVITAFGITNFIMENVQ